MVIQYLSKQTNICSKSATETLEITKDNPIADIFKKQHSEGSIKKLFLNISQNSYENTCAKASFLIKLNEAYNFFKKETLA